MAKKSSTKSGTHLLVINPMSNKLHLHYYQMERLQHEPQTTVKRYGSRQEVWNGEATMTKSKLKKSDFEQGPGGKIMSKKKRLAGRALYARGKAFGGKTKKRTRKTEETNNAPKESAPSPPSDEVKESSEGQDTPIKKKRKRRKKTVTSTEV